VRGLRLRLLLRAGEWRGGPPGGLRLRRLLQLTSRSRGAGDGEGATPCRRPRPCRAPSPLAVLARRRPCAPSAHPLRSPAAAHEQHGVVAPSRVTVTSAGTVVLPRRFGVLLSAWR